MIGIVDYGMGNIRSVSNVIDYLGKDWAIVANPSEIARCSHVLLPGVGAYEEAMVNLSSRNLVAPLQAHCAQGKPFLGICLGMQLLSSIGFEPKECAGLNIIPGKTVLMDEKLGYLLPHVGWNNLKRRRDHPVLLGIKSNVDFYFVHSYCVWPVEADCVIATCDYSEEFNAIIGLNNVLGTQFHPEKSQSSGIKMLKNFCEWDGIC